MSAARREENREVALILTNTLGTSTVYPTGVVLTNSTPIHVSVVDGTGDQITSFGGSTLNTVLLNGQAKIAVTSTAVQLGTNTLKNGVILTAKSTNTANILVGGSGVTTTADGTGNGYILEPGTSASWAVSNTNILYINGTAGDLVSFAGS